MSLATILKPPRRVVAPAPAEPPLIRYAPSPNFNGVRLATRGAVLHATRGNAANPANEFLGTLNWFSRSEAQVSAHIVIANDGTVAECVDPVMRAWHAGQHNDTHLGVEICQSRLGDPISDAQVSSLAWWLKRMSVQFGFPLTRDRLPFHSETVQGASVGKSDAYPAGSADGLAFRRRLEALL